LTKECRTYNHDLSTGHSDVSQPRLINLPLIFGTIVLLAILVISIVDDTEVDVEELLIGGIRRVGPSVGFVFSGVMSKMTQVPLLVVVAELTTEVIIVDICTAFATSTAVVELAVEVFVGGKGIRIPVTEAVW
jgi:hypothetical protein